MLIPEVIFEGIVCLFGRFTVSFGRFSENNEKGLPLVQADRKES